MGFNEYRRVRKVVSVKCYIHVIVYNTVKSENMAMRNSINTTNKFAFLLKYHASVFLGIGVHTC